MAFASFIQTANEQPPIPVRDYDWHAWVEGEEEGPFHGRGATESDALRDLAEQLANAYWSLL